MLPSTRITRFAFLFLAVLWLPASAVRADDTAPLEFQLTFDRAASSEPFTGRVYVMLTKDNVKGLRRGIDWFRPQPTFAVDVQGWKPGEPLTVGSKAMACPTALDKLPKNTYSIQAVMDFDRGSRYFSTADGNVYSQTLRRELDPETSGTVALKLDQVYQGKPLAEDEFVKLVEIESKLLSEFHKRPIKLRAAVALPASYSTGPEKKYPVVYEVPGFGGTHEGAFRKARSKATDVDGVDMLWVVLDPSCRLGHHVFADSDNNGPYGKALTQELIPAIEKKFRAIGTPAARFVTGHSSGGWSSLWLQVTYPDFFGGCWSTSPDPVDFRDFQRINIYRPGENMFTDADSKPRPLARFGEKPVLFYKGFSDMEVVMGHGGQLASFEAVFSPRGKDGKPMQLWDRATGKIDPAVAKSWERYDIRLILENNWKTLGPKLNGKLHVYMGDLDTFYLEGATRLLQESLRKLDSEVAVELFAGKNHGTLLDSKMQKRIASEMAAQFRKSSGE